MTSARAIELSQNRWRVIPATLAEFFFGCQQQGKRTHACLSVSLSRLCRASGFCDVALLLIALFSLPLRHPLSSHNLPLSRPTLRERTKGEQTKEKQHSDLKGREKSLPRGVESSYCCQYRYRIIQVCEGAIHIIQVRSEREREIEEGERVYVGQTAARSNLNRCIHFDYTFTL